jgi:hypothetical protein
MCSGIILNSLNNSADYMSYHNNITNLIHFHKHFIVSYSSTCFRCQASIIRRHTIKCLWKWKCIKLVMLLRYIMIHGQQNIKYMSYIFHAVTTSHLILQHRVSYLWNTLCVKKSTVLRTNLFSQWISTRLPWIKLICRKIWVKKKKSTC